MHLPTPRPPVVSEEDLHGSHMGRNWQSGRSVDFGRDAGAGAGQGWLGRDRCTNPLSPKLVGVLDKLEAQIPNDTRHRETLFTREVCLLSA